MEYGYMHKKKNLNGCRYKKYKKEKKDYNDDSLSEKIVENILGDD